MHYVYLSIKSIIKDYKFQSQSGLAVFLIDPIRKYKNI